MSKTKNDPAAMAGTAIELTGNILAVAAMAGTVFVAPLAGAYLGFTTGLASGTGMAAAMGIGGAAAGAATGVVSLMPLAGANAVLKRAAHMTIVPAVKAATAGVRFVTRMAQKLDAALSNNGKTETPAITTTASSIPEMPSIVAKKSHVQLFGKAADNATKAPAAQDKSPEMPQLPKL